MVRPEIIPPGRTATVTVSVNPLDVGEKLIPITLTTDSQTTPTVNLALHVTGYREPPFLWRVLGDLTYRWDDIVSGSARELDVEAGEIGNRGEVPVAHSDLPFLIVDRPAISEEAGRHAILAPAIGPAVGPSGPSR